MKRDGTLNEVDWEAMYLHRARGADLLKDLGVYGPVAQIVRAHHERFASRATRFRRSRGSSRSPRSVTR
jgi:response regulator RpfG family c-di-GMP phosphodiesterase